MDKYENYKQRHVRYNHRKSDNLLDCNEWYFLIVNDNREIDRIQNRIFEIFAPIKNDFLFVKGNAFGTGLNYKLLGFESSNHVEDYKIRGIFKRTIKDNNLYNRNKKNGLEIYLDEKFK